MKYLSIITSTYNAEKEIGKTIKSVLNQKNEFIEYIIIDGGSSDGTLEIINTYKPFIDYVISEKDNGVYDAMNKGVKVSSGEYIFFLQAGDVIKNNIINTILEIIENDYGHISLIYGSVWWKDKNIVYDGIFDKLKLTQKNICQQSIFYHRKIFSKHGLFELEYKILADYVFNIKCFGDEHIEKKYVDAVIADYDCGMSGIITDEKLTRIRHLWLIQKNLGFLCLIYSIFFSCKNYITKGYKNIFRNIFVKNNIGKR